MVIQPVLFLPPKTEATFIEKGFKIQNKPISSGKIIII
jgi:hypothetical protein